MNELCKTCANRGKINGLSQETFCSGCIHADSWRKDYYLPLEIIDNNAKSEADSDD